MLSISQQILVITLRAVASSASESRSSTEQARFLALAKTFCASKHSCLG